MCVQSVCVCVCEKCGHVGVGGGWFVKSVCMCVQSVCVCEKCVCVCVKSVCVFVCEKCV